MGIIILRFGIKVMQLPFSFESWKLHGYNNHYLSLISNKQVVHEWVDAFRSGCLSSDRTGKKWREWFLLVSCSNWIFVIIFIATWLHECIFCRFELVLLTRIINKLNNINKPEIWDLLRSSMLAVGIAGTYTQIDRVREGK